MQSKGSAKWMLFLVDWLKKEPVIRHGGNLVVLALVVFLLVFSWMSWVEYALTPQVRAGNTAGELTAGGSSADSSTRNKKSLEEYVQGVSEDVFGVGEEEEESEQENPLEDIPVSERGHNLKLMGTIVGIEDLGDRAIIKDKKNNEQKMYQEGDRIRKITVSKILRNNVIIQTPQGEKVLTMQPAELRADKGGEQGTSSASKDPQQYDQTRRISKSYVLDTLQNVGKLMDQALIQRMVQGDETKGFRLDNIQQGSFYDKIGLENKDVINQVDGKDLKKPEQFMDFSQKLKNKDNVTLTVNRNGEQRTINYQLQ